MVKYKLIPNSSMATSQLSYDMTMSAPIPDDVQLDWSEVSHGLMQAAEKAIIIGQMKKIQIPLHINNKIQVCDASEKQWRNIKVRNLVVKPSVNGAQVNFTAEAEF